jgi:arabinoxylan arabinofuranohydrolase
MSTCGGVSYEDFTNITKVPNLNTLGNDASKNLQVKMAAGSWTMLRKVEFGTPGAASLMIRAKGTGKMELRLGSLTNAATATVDIASTAWQDYIVPVDPEAAKGTRNVFFVFTESTNVQFDAWQFGKEDLTAVPSVAPSPSRPAQSYDLSGRPQSASSKGIVLQQSINAQGRAIIRKVLRK